VCTPEAKRKPAGSATHPQADQWERVRALAHDPYFTVDDHILRRYAGTPVTRHVGNDELVVIMMGSSLRTDLARVMHETWLRAYPHVFIVGDVENASVPMMTLPELAGQDDYMAAQHRQLRCIHYIANERPELLDKRYFLLVGAHTC
jgi:hypothetical protein